MKRLRRAAVSLAGLKDGLDRPTLDDGLNAVPDAGRTTLHLRCGDDIKCGLAEAGFADGKRSLAANGKCRSLGGGVRIESGAPAWRWNAEAGTPVLI